MWKGWKKKGRSCTKKKFRSFDEEKNEGEKYKTDEEEEEKKKLEAYLRIFGPGWPNIKGMPEEGKRALTQR